jgi:flagellar FliL protein
MSAKPAAEGAAVAEKPKSKKMLFIIIGVVVLALVGGGAAFFLLKKKPHDDEGAEGAEPVAHAKPAAPPPRKAPDPKTPPTFMPIENMVVNLADPGGGRFAQVGITLKLEDAKTADNVKLYMPSIRNAILMEISKRTADELLGIQGKEKLTRAIVREVSGQLGFELDDEDEEETDPVKAAKKKRRAPAYTPVEAVLFSSFIVQ